MNLTDLLHRALELSPSAAIVLISTFALAVVWKALDLLTRTIAPKSPRREDS